MSDPVSPGRPLPRSVYVRRRVTVVVVLLLIVAVILAIVLWPRDSGGEGDGAAQGNGSAATPDPSETPGDARCQPGRVTISADTDATEYSTGQPVTISFTLENKSGSPCTIDVGSDVQTFTITSPSGSGDEVYWRSTDCQTEPVEQTIILEPGVPKSSTPIVWDRTRSSPDTCDAVGEPQVGSEGASFDLTVTVGSLQSEPRRFYLY